MGEPMNEANYDDYNDFHDCADSVFVENILNYLFMEWEVDISQYPHEIQLKTGELIAKVKNAVDSGYAANIPNIAAKIAMEVIPI